MVLVPPVRVELMAHLRRARDHMDRHFSEPIDLDRLARVAGVSKFHFVRCFEATYGVTDSLMMFKSSKVKKEAFQFLSEAAFTDKWRKEFTIKEGFLPVFKSVAADPHFAQDPNVRAMLFNQRARSGS